MKKGQLLSQPFFYIFAIVVIGLVVIFGFKYLKDVVSTGCKVENLDFVRDVQAEVNQWKDLPSGSNVKCTFTRASGTDYDCEFVVQSDVNGVCFVDTAKGQALQIPNGFDDIKETVKLLSGNTNRNLFFSVDKNAACKIEPVSIKNLEIQKAVCIDVTKENSFVFESAGNKVQIRAA